MTNNERYEIKAMLFYKDTMLLAPGKDDSLGAVSVETRREVWNMWLKYNEHMIDRTLAQVEHVCNI